MHFGEKTRKKSPACRASCKKVETGARVRCSTSSRIYDPTSPSVVHQQRICKWENVLVFCLAVESVRCETPCRIGRRLWLDNVESIQPLASNQGQFIHGKVNIQKWFKRSNALVETPLFFCFFFTVMLYSCWLSTSAVHQSPQVGVKRSAPWMKDGEIEDTAPSPFHIPPEATQRPCVLLRRFGKSHRNTRKNL